MPVHDWKRVDVGIYHHFHQHWSVVLCDALNMGGLPPGYFALIEQATRAGPIPDVLTFQQPPGTFSRRGGNGVALVTAPPRTRFIHKAATEEYAAKADRIAVRHPLGDVVAIVEIVSPGNKDSRHALRSFVDKAVGLLYQGIHLLLVDLFPPGRRDPQGIHKAIWDEIQDEPFELPADKPRTLAAYSAGIPKTAYVEPVAVGDSLPDMPLFLTPDSHVPVPLEATYWTTWTTCPEPLKALLAPPRGESACEDEHDP